MTVQICVKLVGCDVPLRFVCEKRYGADEVREWLRPLINPKLARVRLLTAVSRPVLVMSQVQAIWVEVE